MSRSRMGCVTKALIIVGGTVLALLFIRAILFSNEEPRKPAYPTRSPATIKAVASAVTYDALARNTERYEGRTITFSGVVLQVIEGSSQRATLRIGMDVRGEPQYDAVVLVHYGGPRLLEDDKVTIWGEVRGRVSYKTVLGATVTVPEIEGLIVEHR